MSNTKHYTDSLSAYLDGALNAVERAQVSAHLAACEQCRSDLEELRYEVAMMRALPVMRAPRSFTLSPEMAARARPAWRLDWLYNTLRGFAAVAAVLLVLVTSADLLTLNRTGASQAAPVPAVMSLPEQSQTGSAVTDQASNQSKSSPTTAAPAAPAGAAAISTAVPAQRPTVLPPVAVQSAPSSASPAAVTNAHSTGTPFGTTRSAAAAETPTVTGTPTASATAPAVSPTAPLSVTITLFPTLPVPVATALPSAAPAPAPFRPAEIGLLGALLLCAAGALVVRFTRR